MTIVRVKTNEGKVVDREVDGNPHNVKVVVKKALLDLELTEADVQSARINPRD